MKKIRPFDIFAYLTITIFAVFCIIPLLLILMVSLTDEKTLQMEGYKLFPSSYSIEAYLKIFSGNSIIVNSYTVTIVVTVIGTSIAVLITAMGAYTLANKQVQYRNKVALFFYFSMLFNGGIVPWYLINTRVLKIQDTILALIIPGLLFSVFNLFLVRNYMKGIPDALRESAIIDGAGEANIAFRIYFPLSIPVLAAITLFYGMAYWNDWWNSIMLINNKKLYPLQYMLYQLQSNAQMLRDLQNRGISAGSVEMPRESLKMATVMVTIGPIILLYPFLQRYFVKGLIVGSVKG